MTASLPYLALADDDPDDQEFFCSAMQRLYPQVEVRNFMDAEDLLEYLHQCPLAMLPGCIVLDYKMPRLTAPKFLQATGAGSRYAHIPKVVWSSSHRKKDMDECLHLGAVDFVIKPVTDAQLDELLLGWGRYVVR